MADDLTPFDRDIVIRTILGEAANQGEAGQAGVAHVIRNRLLAGGYGDSPAEIVTAPKQFTPWMTRTGELLGYKPDSPAYQNVGGIVDRVWKGEFPDNTGGATHFANEAASDPVNQRGWIAAGKQKGFVRINNHIFMSPDSAPGRRTPTGPSLDDFEAEPASQAATPANVPAKAASPAKARAPSLDDFEAAKPSILTDPSAAEALRAGLQAKADERLVGPASAKGAAVIGAMRAANTAALGIPLNIATGIETAAGKLGVPGYADRSFADRYQQALAEEAALARQHRVAAGAGTVAGIGVGALALPTLPVAEGAGLAGRAITNAATGGGYGLVGGAIESHDPRTAAISGGAGVVGGAALTPIAEGIGRLIGRLIAGKLRDPAKAFNPDGTLTDEGLQVFQSAGIDTKKMSPELQAAVRDTVTARRGQIGEGLGGAVESPIAAAEQVIGGVKSKAAQAKADYEAGFEDAFSREGKFSPGTFDKVGARITQDIENRGKNSVFVDDKTTPHAVGAIDTLNNIPNLKLGGVAPTAAERVPIPEPQLPSKVDSAGYREWKQAHDAWEAGPKETIVPAQSGPLDLAGVDQARRRLVQSYSAAKSSGNDADIRAVRSITDAFDNHIEEAMAKGLFSGDDKALDALRKARGLVTNYRRTFTQQGSRDYAGRLMEQIIEHNAQPQTVANALFGVANVGGKDVSVQLAGRLRGALGEDSPEWGGIRQGLWQRLTAKPEGVDDFGPREISNRIGQFLNGDGKALSSLVYTAEERAAMANFANLLKTVSAQSSTAVGSKGSVAGEVLTKLANNAHNIAAMIGFAHGSVGGMAAGYGIAKALQTAVSRSGAGGDIARINRSVAKAQPAPPRLPLEINVSPRLGTAAGLAQQ